MESDKNSSLAGSSVHVNRGGLPMDETTWEKMWEHVAKVHPDGYAVVEQIRGNTGLIQTTIPQPPVLSQSMTVPVKLQAIQAYLEKLQYNHTGTQFFEIKKGRPLSRMMEKAKEIVKGALPIKCLEAVIVGLYLTCGLSSAERFVIGFKTRCEGHCHKHVVLGVYHSGLFGCLGLSRRADLMYKPLAYHSLYELVSEFRNSYEQYFHEVLRVKLSLPVVHDLSSGEKIHWGHLKVDIQKLLDADVKHLLDRYSREMKTKSFHVPLPPLRCEASPTDEDFSGPSDSQQVPQGASSASIRHGVQLKSGYKVQV